MFLLDTNVISETFKPLPDGRVSAWMQSTPIEQMFVSSITKAELLYGLALLPDGKKKQTLASVIQAFLETRIVNPVESFGEDDAVVYARISAYRKKIGHKIRELDAQIAAIAATRGLAVATRNVWDFENCGVEIVNPWGEQQQ
jgi:predicted nucleic acid-binding protein